MAAIPQIVQGSMVDTAPSNVKVDSGAFRQAALAPGQVAGAIGDSVGGLFADVGMKIQANRNARTLFQSDLAMRQAKDNFDAQLHKMPDETTWLPAWKEQSDAVRNQILDNPNVGPDMRRTLTMKLDSWQQATTSETKIAALLRGAKNTREDAITDATYIAMNATSPDHLKSAIAVYDHAVDSYAMSRADADKHIARLPNIAAKSMANNIIANDPIHAPSLIQQFKPMMEPPVFEATVREADRRRNAKQGDNIHAITSEIGVSDDHTYPMDKLDAQLKDGQITEEGYKQAVNLMTGARIKETKEKYAEGQMDAYNHDWANDRKREKTVRDFKDKYAFLPDAQRLPLYKQLDEYAKVADNKDAQTVRPVETQVLNQMEHDRTEQGAFIPFTEKSQSGDETQYSHRISGGVKALMNPDVYSDEQIKKDFGPSATREKVLEAEKLHAAQMFQQMRDWFRDPANKDATIEQANKARQTFERPWVMSAVAKVAQKQPRLVRQNGKTYNFDTGEEVK